MPETSLKEDIASAVAEYEEEETEEVDEVSTETAPETPKEEVSAAESETTPEEPEETPEPELVADTSYKPPVAWSPTLKTEWENLNEETKKGIAEYEHQREQQVGEVLQQSTEARRIADGFVRLVEPYRALMASEGAADPFQAIQGLMNVTAQLKMGSPQEKAQRIAGLIQHYGVDIEVLDSVLAGQAPPQQTQQQAIPQQPMYDPRVDQILAQREQQVVYEADQTIAQFAADPQHEFYENVRLSMADEMDLARMNGQHMTPQQAYDIACRKNPEINEILFKRRMSESLAGPGMMDKRNAASSIHGKRSGATDANNKDQSLRETLIAAADGQLGDSGRV
jgi:hypothetical protein